MKVAYVAGPFRAENSWEIEQNIRQAEGLALALWRLGYAVICPHTNTRFFQGAAPDSIWLEGDIEIMKRCDVVVMTPDWARSTGATKEHEVAKLNNIRIAYSIKQAAEVLTQLKEEGRQIAIDFNEAG